MTFKGGWHGPELTPQPIPFDVETSHTVEMGLVLLGAQGQVSETYTEAIETFISRDLVTPVQPDIRRYYYLAGRATLVDTLSAEEQPFLAGTEQTIDEGLESFKTQLRAVLEGAIEANQLSVLSKFMRSFNSAWYNAGILLDCRAEINELDEGLLKSLADGNEEKWRELRHQRLRVAAKIWEPKRLLHMPVEDKGREAQMREKWQQRAVELGADPDAATELLEELLEESKKAQAVQTEA